MGTVTGILTPDRHAACAALAILSAAALVSYAVTWLAALGLRIPGHVIALRRLRSTPPFADAARVAFVTDDTGRRFFLTTGRPLQLRITRPAPAAITAGVLPCPVTGQSGTLFVVDEFTEDGWVISGQVPGICIEGWLCTEPEGAAG
jgi:hypothetical protein